MKIQDIYKGKSTLQSREQYNAKDNPRKGLFPLGPF